MAAVKHTPHKFYLEPESKDSFKFLDSGADDVYLTANNQMMSIDKINSTDDAFNLIQSRSQHRDIMILEGLRHHDIPLIEVYDSTREENPKFPVDSLCAIISDKPIQVGIPNFNRDDIEAISNFLEEYNG